MQNSNVVTIKDGSKFFSHLNKMAYLYCLDSQKIENAAALAFVVDGSFVTASNVSNGIAIDPKNTFFKGENVSFLGRIVVDKELTVYAQIYKGDLPVQGKSYDFRVVPNPIGYRVWNRARLGMPGEYRLVLSTEGGDLSTVFFEHKFYIKARRVGE